MFQHLPDQGYLGLRKNHILKDQQEQMRCQEGIIKHQSEAHNL